MLKDKLIHILFAIPSIFRNQLILYTISRYFISGLSFLTSLIIAYKLGAYYLGVWGLFLLLRRYFQIGNLGIPDSVTVLLVHNKDDEEKKNAFISSSLLLLSIISFVIVSISVIYNIFGFSYLERYNISWEFNVLCCIAILTLYNDLFFKIFRVYGRVYELIFYQSIIQVLSFVVTFLFSGISLVRALLFSYLIGNIFSILLFYYRRPFSFKKNIDLRIAKRVINKGFYLFLYNFFFYLIFLITRTVISSNYKVEEFGFFTFAYTLSNGVILLIDAIAALIVPKILDKYNTVNIEEIKNVINLLWDNYIKPCYGLMYLLIIVFTLLICFMNNYYHTFDIVIYTCITVTIQAHSFPYTTLLISKNKEKILAFVSILIMLLNSLLVLILVYILHVRYQYVVLGSWISYCVFSLLCVYFAHRIIGEDIKMYKLFKESFPVKITIPLVFLLVIVYFELRYLICLPFLIYAYMNKQMIIVLMQSFKKIFFYPQIINIK